MVFETSTKKKKKKNPKRSNSDLMLSPPPSQPRIRTSKFRSLLRRRGSSIPLLLLSLSLLLLLCISWNNFSSSSIGSDSEFYSFEIVNEFPHDPNAFTQGLLYAGNDTLLESTGLYGRSSVRQVLLQTGKVQVYNQMDRSEFGEGLTLLGERLFQVTWLKNTGFIYDRDNLNRQKKFTHQMKDGWGLATDGRVIFGSDGSSTLYQLDPLTWEALDKVTVKYNNLEIPFLNELEFVNGKVWANVWQSDCIARISPSDGAVRSWILLHELRNNLLNSGYNGIDVLNGIAWDGDNERLFVTGKLWPKLYEIKLRPVKPPLNRKIEDLCSIRT